MLLHFGACGRNAPTWCTRTYSPLLQVARAQRVERGEALPSEEGCNGYCPLVAGLPYLDYKFMWRLPLAHAMLSGIVPDFINLIITTGTLKEEERPWYGLSLDARRMIEVRSITLLALPLE